MLGLNRQVHHAAEIEPHVKVYDEAFQYSPEAMRLADWEIVDLTQREGELGFRNFELDKRFSGQSGKVEHFVAGQIIAPEDDIRDFPIAWVNVPRRLSMRQMINGVPSNELVPVTVHNQAAFKNFQAFAKIAIALAVDHHINGEEQTEYGRLMHQLWKNQARERGINCVAEIDGILIRAGGLLVSPPVETYLP